MNLFRKSRSPKLYYVSSVLFALFIVVVFSSTQLFSFGSSNTMGTYSIALAPLSYSERTIDTTFLVPPLYLMQSAEPSALQIIDTSWVGVTDRGKGYRVRHLLGTNRYGQDYFQQVMEAVGMTLIIALVSALFSVIIGFSVALYIGFSTTVFGSFTRKIVDLFVVIPLVLVVIFASTILWSRSLFSIVVLLSAFSWPWTARRLYPRIFDLSNSEYVRFDRTRGMPFIKLFITRYMPDLLVPLLTAFLVQVGLAIFQEIGLSVIGSSLSGRVTLGQLLIASQSSGAIIDNLWWIFGAPMAVFTFLQLVILLQVSGLSERFKGSVFE